MDLIARPTETITSVLVHVLLFSGLDRQESHGGRADKTPVQCPLLKPCACRLLPLFVLTKLRPL